MTWPMTFEGVPLALTAAVGFAFCHVLCTLSSVKLVNKPVMYDQVVNNKYSGS